MPAPLVDNIRFPDQISEGAIGGPEFLTTVIIGGGGQEQRFAHWSVPRYRWDVSHGVKSPAMGEELLAFFIAREGRRRGFRFKDWVEWKVTTPTALDLISTTSYQLTKRYTSGSITRVRNIYAPVAGTVKVFNGAVEVVGGWSVDTATGIVTFGSPPAFSPLATFDFDVPARFDTDVMRLELTHVNRRDWAGIPVIELKG